MNRRDFIKFGGMGALSLFLGGCALPWTEGDKAGQSQKTAAAAKNPRYLAHQVQDESAPAVYLVKGVDEDAVFRAYTVAGRRLTGNVGIKLTFESPGGPHYLWSST